MCQLSFGGRQMPRFSPQYGDFSGFALVSLSALGGQIGAELECSEYRGDTEKIVVPLAENLI